VALRQRGHARLAQEGIDRGQVAQRVRLHATKDTAVGQRGRPRRVTIPRAMQPNAATLRLALIPRTDLLTNAFLVVVGLLAVAGAAQIRIPLADTPVPITGQTFAVLLVGAAYGAPLGFATLVAYWLVGLAGAPVYAEGKSGWDTFVGPTGGYIVGFMAAALLTGWLAQKRWDRSFKSSLSAMLLGNVVIYLPGLLWLAHYLDTGLNATLEAGLYPFVLGDTIKLFLAGALLPAAWLAVKRFRGES
jgi:biotin transport system substrate-specific component